MGKYGVPMRAWWAAAWGAEFRAGTPAALPAEGAALPWALRQASRIVSVSSRSAGARGDRLRQASAKVRPWAGPGTADGGLAPPVLHGQGDRWQQRHGGAAGDPICVSVVRLVARKLASRALASALNSPMQFIM